MSARKSLSLVVGFILLALFATAWSTAAPSKLNYQAVLQTASGQPVTTPVTVVFTIYDAATLGNALWTESRNLAPDAAGRVNVLLGDNTPIGETVFNGPNRWLGIRVGADPEMPQRTQMASSAYSRRVSTVDGATGGTMDGNLTLRSTAALEKDSEAAQAAQLTLISLNGDTVKVGPADQLVFSAVDPSGTELMTATLTGPNGPTLGVRDSGGNRTEHTASSSSYFSGATKDVNAEVKQVEIGADGVTVYNPDGSVMMRVNPSTGQIAATGLNIGPNLGLVANKDALAVCGANALSETGADEQLNNAVGPDNDLSGASSSFSVGACNIIDNTVAPPAQYVQNATAFGERNFIGSNQSFVFGFSNLVDMGSSQMTIFGSEDTISTDGGLQSSIGSSILGGQKNFIIGPVNTIVSGNGNRISRNKVGTIITSNNSTIAGGNLGRISGSSFSFIAGGERNIIDIDSNGSVPFNHGVIGGGADNVVSKDGATIAGGYFNWARGANSTVGGGNTNRAIGGASTVAGGSQNTADGVAAMILGGEFCNADGSYSFASGRRAKSNHDGAFVWADHTNSDFASTGVDQFLIRAAGNVGINTNAPSQPLTVAGTIYSTSGGIKFPDGSVQSSAATSITDGWTDDGATVRLTAGTDNVGIGTSSPTEKLHVDGNLKVTGTITSGTSSITMDGVNEEIKLGTGASNSMTLKSTGLGGMISLKHSGFPDDSTNFGPNSTVFDRVANGALRVKMTASSAGANMVMKSSSGARLVEMDGSNAPSTVHKNSFNSDSSRVSASSVYLGSDIGSSELSGGHMDFLNSSGNNAVAISADGTGIIVYNSSGNERVRIDATGIRGDSTGGVALEHLTPGGTKIYTNAAKTAGAQLTAGSGSWSSLSDVNSKENVENVDLDEVLEKISKLDVASWNYKSQDDAIRHIGPMAQDLYALFGFGEDERHISTVDADGIALAAIKALYNKTQELESQKTEIDALRDQIAELKQLVESMSHQR